MSPPTPASRTRPPAHRKLKLALGAMLAPVIAIAIAEVSEYTHQLEAYELRAGVCGGYSYTLRLRPDGLFTFDGGGPLTQAEVIERVKSIYATNPEGRIILYAAPETPLPTIQTFMEHISAAGWKKVFLATTAVD